MAAIFGTRRHPLGNLELRLAGPDTGVVDAEHGKVLRLDLRHVRLVRDRERAASEVVEAQRVHCTIRKAATGARVVAVAKVDGALGRSKVRRLGLVACEFGGGWLPRVKLEKVSGVRRMIKVTMEPPLVEGHVQEGRHGAVVVWIGLVGDVETVHTGVPEGCINSCQYGRSRRCRLATYQCEWMRGAQHLQV